MKEESPIDKYQYTIRYMIKGSPEEIRGYAITQGWAHSRTSLLARWILMHPNSGELVEMAIPKKVVWGKPWNTYIKQIAKTMARVGKTTLQDVDYQFQVWADKERQETMKSRGVGKTDTEEAKTFKALGMTFNAIPLSAKEEVGLWGSNVCDYESYPKVWNKAVFLWVIRLLRQRAHVGEDEFVTAAYMRDDEAAVNHALTQYTTPQLLYMCEKLLEYCKPTGLPELREMFPDE